MDYSKVILHAGKERSVYNRHLWLFSGAIKKIEGAVKEGSIVEVFSSDNTYLATGHFHDGSIKVRIFSFEQREINADFWKGKIQSAFEFRKRLGFINNQNTNAYRLINAEGDELPGLVIDVYNDIVVIQSHTIGMHLIKKDLVQILQNLFPAGQSIFDKSADTMGKDSGIENGLLHGDKTETVITENGIKFYVNVSEGQKTGFFLDQRDNRQLLGSYASGKKVLNTFAYSGGFSMYALKSNAELVHSVDSSKKAADWAAKNVSLNYDNSAPHEFFPTDVFQFLKASDQKYDLIILDPPAFAKSRAPEAIKQATIGYRNLNHEALKRIAPGGILFTFSCSQPIDKELFRKIVFTAAAQTRRNVCILHQLTQPADHPINIYHPEGEYLTGLVLYVE